MRTAQSILVALTLVFLLTASGAAVIRDPGDFSTQTCPGTQPDTAGAVRISAKEADGRLICKFAVTVTDLDWSKVTGPFSSQGGIVALYNLNHVTDAGYKLDVSAPGYLPYTRNTSSNLNNIYVLILERGPDYLSIVKTNGIGAVTITATDKDGFRVDNFTATLTDPATYAVKGPVSSRGGAVTFANLANYADFTYQVNVSAPGYPKNYSSYIYALTVNGIEEWKAGFDSILNTTLTPWNTGKGGLRVMAVDKDGLKLSSFTATLTDPVTGTVIGPVGSQEGAVTFTNLTNYGSYSYAFTVSAPGYSTYKALTRIPANRTLDYSVIMEKGSNATITSANDGIGSLNITAFDWDWFKENRSRSVMYDFTATLTDPVTGAVTGPVSAQDGTAKFSGLVSYKGMAYSVSVNAPGFAQYTTYLPLITANRTLGYGVVLKNLASSVVTGTGALKLLAVDTDGFSIDNFTVKIEDPIQLTTIPLVFAKGGSTTFTNLTSYRDRGYQIVASATGVPRHPSEYLLYNGNYSVQIAPDATTEYTIILSPTSTTTTAARVQGNLTTTVSSVPQNVSTTTASVEQNVSTTTQNSSRESAAIAAQNSTPVSKRFSSAWKPPFYNVPVFSRIYRLLGWRME